MTLSSKKYPLYRFFTGLSSGYPLLRSIGQHLTAPFFAHEHAPIAELRETNGIFQPRGEVALGAIGRNGGHLTGTSFAHQHLTIAELREAPWTIQPGGEVANRVYWAGASVAPSSGMTSSVKSSACGCEELRPAAPSSVWVEYHTPAAITLMMIKNMSFFIS